MRNPRAIVCDDRYEIRDVLKTILETAGCEVLTADTPIMCAFYREQAETCPQNNRCADILITDYDMPGMTGLELLEIQHYRGCKLTSKNKALMTALDSAELREQAGKLGCHFFKKPVYVSKLLAWIRECLERVDLSEPLAADLFLPAKKESFCVGSDSDIKYNDEMS